MAEIEERGERRRRDGRLSGSKGMVAVLRGSIEIMSNEESANFRERAQSTGIISLHARH